MAVFLDFIFVPYIYVLITIAVQQTLGLTRQTLPPLLFFSKISLAILVSLPLHLNFRRILSVVQKDLAVNLVGITLNLYINLGELTFF